MKVKQNYVLKLSLFVTQSKFYNFYYLSISTKSTYCGSAFERNLPWNTSESDVEALNFGISNFNNILYAFLSGLNFLTFTGWSNINDIVKKILKFYYFKCFLVLEFIFIFCGSNL